MKPGPKPRSGTTMTHAERQARYRRAVQRCRLAVTESALQHLMDEVRRLIARGISEPAIV